MLWVSSHSGTTVLSSAQEVLQNTPIQRLKCDNPTTGLSSGKLATRPGGFSITFKPLMPRQQIKLATTFNKNKQEDAKSNDEL
jgi:hypothetical protein